MQDRITGVLDTFTAGVHHTRCHN